MTLGTQVTYAKRRARVSSNSLTESNTDDVVRQYINDGVQEFCRRLGGVPKEEYLTVTPKFDLRTNFAIRFTITSGANALAATDLVLCTASHVDVSGGTVASAINAQISNVLGLSVTLSWDSASWLFTLRDNASAATAIEVDEPARKTYVDATLDIFGKTGTANATTFEGTLPVDCTVETSLPSDFLQIEHVEWDGRPIGPAPYDLFVSPNGSGDPSWYAIKNKQIRLAPCPSQQKKLLIRYKAMPADLDTDGTDDAVECPLPTPYHMLPVYWAEAMLLQEQHEHEKARSALALFAKGCGDYKARESNQNPTLFPTQRIPSIPRVVMPDG